MTRAHISKQYHKNRNFGTDLIIRTSSPKGNDRSPENKIVFLNSSLVSKRFFSIGQGQPTLQSRVDQILNSIKGCYSVANLQKK